MEVYGSIVSEYQDRIIKVFIRQTTFNPNEKQKELWKNLKNTGVDATYFNDEDEAKKEIDKLTDSYKEI